MIEIADVVIIILFVSGCGYLCVVAILGLAIGKVRSGTSQEHPFVSVVIAARNEENHIAACLDNLRVQNYPTDRYEVIVADDRSVDGTSEILAAYGSDWPEMTIVSIDTTPEGISPKKHALSMAISLARGEIILQTDADCVVPSLWITGMIARFEQGIDLVAGIAPYRQSRGIISRFVTHEYIWNVLLSAGSIVLGSGTHVSGRNMAFRRSVFMEIDGYGDKRNILSGDDTLLMQRFQHRRKGSVATNPDPMTHVYTDPPSSFSALVRQRIRHMSTGRYFHPLQIGTGVIVYGFHATMLISIVLAPFIPLLGIAAALAFLVKVICDAIAFARAGRVFSLGVPWRFFIFGEILCTLYFSLFPFFGVIVPVTWKENR